MVVSDYTALLSGLSWADGVPGQAVLLTYSFSAGPTTTLLATNPAAAASFMPLDAGQRSTIRNALDRWAAVSGITFHEVTLTPGDLTFGIYDLSAMSAAEEAALANYPSTGTFINGAGPQIYRNFASEGGDVYFDRAYLGNPAYRDDFAHVAIHEIGHALGLKHPFDTRGNTLAPELDNGSQTVMAYAGTRSATPGPLDIAAIRHLYGSETGAARPVSQTWHADTEAITTIGTAAAEVMFGGGGNDVFFSIGGRDAISGAEGDDIVYAAGEPIAVNGGPGKDTVVTGLTWTADTGVGGNGTFRFIALPDAVGSIPSQRFQSFADVELLVFSNGVYSTVTNTFSAVQPGTYAWTGMLGPDWASPANWRTIVGGSAAQHPGAPDQAVIALPATIAGTASVARLQIDAALRLDGARIDVGGEATLATQAAITGRGAIAAGHFQNDGLVTAEGGTLRIEGAAGSGGWQVGAGATLSLSALPGRATFAGPGGTLRLDTVSARAVIAGFAPGDTLAIGSGANVTGAAFYADTARSGMLRFGDVAVSLTDVDPNLRYAGHAEAGIVTVTARTGAADWLFDAGYYLAANPDVAAAGVDPLAHYHAFGWREGRNPDALFDTRLYLTANPDVAAAAVDPLLHYETRGWIEGRDPSLLFSGAKYLAANADVAAAGVDPLVHFLRFGQAEGRMSFLSGGTSPANPLIDPATYDRELGATLLPSGLAAQQQAAWSFELTGWQAGLNPNPWFDTQYYLAHAPDVAAGGTNPLRHFDDHGWHEGRDPSAAFSTSGYLAANPDVAAASLNPLRHYITAGAAEGRLAVPV